MNNPKALIVGGSNGIGLAIAVVLCENGYDIVIADREEPDYSVNLDPSKVTFYKTDLRYFNESLFEKLRSDNQIKLLMITAGFGRVAPFEDFDNVEIEKSFMVNSIAITKIICLFYNRIKSKEVFYCGVMGSIAGWVCSPLMAVYSATKGAVCKFIEGVNTELEVSGSTNRILNVSPGVIRGTKFHDNVNNIALTKQLAYEIVKALKRQDTIYIPDYNTIYKGVLERYISNPHKFGIDSFYYKQKSGNSKKKQIKIGYLSGTFDLFHVGHLNLLKRAKSKCDYLIVGVHPDGSHKKKQVMISFKDRMEIVSACKYVDKVIKACPEDNEAWAELQYNYLFVGSDYKGTERFKKYEEFFADKDVEIIYFPYTKGISSTLLRHEVLNNQ